MSKGDQPVLAGRETFVYAGNLASDFTANTALTMGKWTPGILGLVDEFGFIVDTAFTSGGALALKFQLQDASSNVIAEVTLAEATIITAPLARGDVFRVTGYTAANDGLRSAFALFDASTVLTLKRISGTVATGGNGRFYVRTTQRLPQ